MEPRAPITEFISALHTHLSREAPALLPHFTTYAEEACFGAAWLTESLEQIPPGSDILEVGAGAGILACHLQRSGYRVTALEPTGQGFGHFDALRAQVLSFARATGPTPEWLHCRAEALTTEQRFHFAYSLNVMEHVDDVVLTLQRVTGALLPGSAYRFVCPNYAFPFEPHFGLPILATKAMTYRIFQRRIRTAPGIANPQGLWDSLNWITVNHVERLSRTYGLMLHWNRTILAFYIQRALNDPAFCARHPHIRRCIRLLEIGGLSRSLSLLPTRWLPVMDGTVRLPIKKAIP